MKHLYPTLGTPWALADGQGAFLRHGSERSTVIARSLGNDPNPQLDPGTRYQSRKLMN
jgi:hypothetical protein